MKKRYWWLATCFALSASGAAAFWFLTAGKITDGPQTDDNATAQEAPKPAKIKSSPVLGKDMPSLPEYCADKLISVSGCDGMTEITTDQGNTYRLVEIGDQCWFEAPLREYSVDPKVSSNSDPSNPFVPTLKYDHWKSPSLYKYTEEFDSAGEMFNLCPDSFRVADSCDFLKRMRGDEAHKVLYYPTGYYRDGRPFLGHVGYFWVDAPVPTMMVTLPRGMEGQHELLYFDTPHDGAALAIRCIMSKS